MTAQPAPASSDDAPPTTHVGSLVLAAFEGFGDDPEGALERMRPLYAPDMVFRDPLHTLHGYEAFVAMNLRVARRANVMRFTILNLTETPDQFYLTWIMDLDLKRGPTMRVEGVTRGVVRDGLVREHIDYWDLLGAGMDTIPGVRAVYRAIVSRLG